VRWARPSRRWARDSSGGIREFLGQQPHGGAQLTTADEGVETVGERGHVADGDRPLVRVAPNSLAGEAQLQGSVRQDLEVQAPLGAPERGWARFN
jgi:hypothetical protein